MTLTDSRRPPSLDDEPPEEQLVPRSGSELTQQLLELVQSGDLESPKFRQGLEALEQEYQDEVYAELLFLLSHLRFSPPEAREHWQKIVEHRERLAAGIQSAVDLRAALVSYFLDSHTLLESPTVIELRVLENARNFAFRDSLTGLYNYRFLRDYLPREIWRADQYNTPLSLVVADVDDFKIYNDRYGHEEGNAALSRIAVLLEESLRKIDIAVRFGGEEFVLILPLTPKTGARSVAERAREVVWREEMQGGESLTLSMGVATYPADASDQRELLRHADRAMYDAKSKGKNQVELFGNDRRSFSRIRLALNGELREMSPQAYPFETIDVGSGGLRFLSDRSMAVGSLVDVDLLISKTAGSLRLAGRVVSSRETETGGFETAVRIVEIDSQERRQLGLCLRQASTSAELA